MKLTCSSLLTLLCTAYFVRNTDGERILAILPANMLSHFTMFHEMMKSLADRGHQVDVVSHFPQKKRYPNYTDIVSLAGTISTKLNNMTLDYLDNFTENPAKFLVNVYGDQLCALLEQPGLQELIKNPPTDPPYDLVITEYFFAHCYFAFGRHLKVPVIAITPSRIFPHSNEALGNPIESAFVFELGDNSPMSFGKRFMNTLITNLMIYESKYYTEPQTDVVRKHFGAEMPNIRELEKDLSLLLVNSHHSLTGIRPFTPAIVEVGGLHVRDDNVKLSAELQAWLDESNDGVIYISFGSMMKIESFPKKILAEFYAAFAKISPIRVLIKVASPKDLPPGIPENVMTLIWAPQISVLKHKNVRAFLAHGGLLGVQEAVVHGVPIIGMPLFGDQALNVNDCVNRGVAVSLDYKNLDAEKIVAAVNAVLHDPTYKQNMLALSKKFMDRPTSPRETAVFWIEYVMKHGGDVLRSPAVRLTWWQLALLDVYGSVIVSILLALYVIKRIFVAILYRIGLYKNESPLKSKKRD